MNAMTDPVGKIKAEPQMNTDKHRYKAEEVHLRLSMFIGGKEGFSQ